MNKFTKSIAAAAMVLSLTGCAAAAPDKQRGI